MIPIIQEHIYPNTFFTGIFGPSHQRLSYRIATTANLIDRFNIHEHVYQRCNDSAFLNSPLYSDLDKAFGFNSNSIFQDAHCINTRFTIQFNHQYFISIQFTIQLRSPNFISNHSDFLSANTQLQIEAIRSCGPTQKTLTMLN